MSSVRPLFKEQTHTGVCSPAGWKIDQDTDICLLFAFFRAQVRHSLPDGPQEAIKNLPKAICPKSTWFYIAVLPRLFIAFVNDDRLLHRSKWQVTCYGWQQMWRKETVLLGEKKRNGCWDEKTWERWRCDKDKLLTGKISCIYTHRPVLSCF